MKRYFKDEKGNASLTHTANIYMLPIRYSTQIAAGVHEWSVQPLTHSWIENVHGSLPQMTGRRASRPGDEGLPSRAAPTSQLATATDLRLRH